MTDTATIAAISRPILFSAPMVRALRSGTKTQTRRVINLSDRLGRFDSDGYSSVTDDRIVKILWTNQNIPKVVPCPYGQPGDRLRVKEAAWMWCERRPNGKTATGRDRWWYVPMREAPIHYAADHPSMPMLDVVSPNTVNKWGWRLKIGRFLPAWASRITLENTGVRVERLQDISITDAMAEGVAETNANLRGLEPCMEWRYAYEDLWTEINGTGSWAANPWVWVVEFRRIAQ